MQDTSFKPTETKPKGYHQLKVVAETKRLIKSIYVETEKFPKIEQYGLTSQIRRAAVSIVLNVVEGQRRRSGKEFLRFLEIADASAAEVEVCLELALELHMITDESYKEIEQQRQTVTRMLNGLIKKIKQNT